MRRWHFLAIAAVGLGLAACGDEDEKTGPEKYDGIVDMSGVVVPHPISAGLPQDLWATLDLSNTRFDILTPSQQSRGSVDVDGSGEGCAFAIDATTGAVTTKCPWSTKVDIKGVALGLAAALTDTREGDKVWATTGSGVISDDDINEVIAVEGKVIDGRTVFAIPNAVIGAKLDPAGQGAGMLPANTSALEKGFVLGMVLGADKKPVAGATVTAKSGEVIIPVLHLNQAEPTAGKTDATGMFVVFAPADQTSLTIMSLSAVSDDGTKAWGASSPFTGVTRPQTAYSVMMTGPDGAE